MTSRDWTVEALGPQHETGAFDCGEAALNGYLVNHALDNSNRGLSRTFVAVRPTGRSALGYYTVCAGAVARDSAPRRARGGTPYPTIPALHLGRLAVDLRHQRQGLGECLLMDALARCERVADQVGIRLLEVKALNDRARSFYARYGFLSLLDDKNHLYLSVKQIRKLALND